MRISVPGNTRCPETGRIESYGRQACDGCPYLDDEGTCIFEIKKGDFIPF